jgi:hypothetical protein
VGRPVNSAWQFLLRTHRRLLCTMWKASAPRKYNRGSNTVSHQTVVVCQPPRQPRRCAAAPSSPSLAVTRMLPTASETSPGDPRRPSLPRPTPA